MLYYTQVAREVAALSETRTLSLLCKQNPQPQTLIHVPLVQAQPSTPLVMCSWCVPNVFLML